MMRPNIVKIVERAEQAQGSRWTDIIELTKYVYWLEVQFRVPRDEFKPLVQDLILEEDDCA